MTREQNSEDVDKFLSLSLSLSCVRLIPHQVLWELDFGDIQYFSTGMV